MGQQSTKLIYTVTSKTGNQPAGCTPISLGLYFAAEKKQFQPGDYQGNINVYNYVVNNEQLASGFIEYTGGSKHYQHDLEELNNTFSGLALFRAGNSSLGDDTDAPYDSDSFKNDLSNYIKSINNSVCQTV